RQATYLGGTGDEEVDRLAIHPGTGEIYAGGFTNSTSMPCFTASGQCGNGAQSVRSGPGDAYVTRLSPDLRQYRQTTYYGGGASDNAYTMATLPNGEVLIGGSTTSNDLPCTTAGGGCANGAQSAFP